MSPSKHNTKQKQNHAHPRDVALMWQLLKGKIRLLQPELRAEAALEVARRAHLFSDEQTQQHSIATGEDKVHGEPAINWDDGTLNPAAIDVVTIAEPPSIRPGKL